MKKILLVIIISLFIPTICFAESNWILFYSDNQGEDYYNPNSLKIVRDIIGDIDHVEMWFKTTFTEEERKIAINQGSIEKNPKVNQVSYRLLNISIYPANKTSKFQKEVFYDKDGNVLWTNNSDSFTDVIPNEYDEKYYSIITDVAFHNGKKTDFEKWQQNKDRWIYLLKRYENNGVVSYYWFDTSLLTIKDNFISGWIYTEDKLDGSTVKFKHIKFEYNTGNNQYRFVNTSEWSKEKGWHDEQFYNSEWSSLIPDSQGEYWFKTINKYVNENQEKIIENMHIK